MLRKLGQTYYPRYISKRTICDSPDNDVLFHYVNNTVVIRLNKPKTLNALTYSMIERIHSKMKEWCSDRNIQKIIIKSTQPKAFSAGGDIKALSIRSSYGESIRTSYLTDEYQLIYLIGTSRLPYIALINGMTMGGGCGLSVHGSFRLATELTVVAMPETAIGLFPNAGGSYFLPRLSHNLGVFLGLTGHRLRGMDVVHAGIATHFIPTSRLEEVEQQLLHLPNHDYNSIKEFLDKSAQSVVCSSKFSLEKQVPLINQIFSIDVPNVETILQQLEIDGSSFSLKQLSKLKKLSPTSLKITLEQLKRGKKLNLKECLKMEYRILQRVMKSHDFYEGVRAVLIDKNNNTKWKPDALEDLSDVHIATYFEKLPHDKELQL